MGVVLTDRADAMVMRNSEVASMESSATFRTNAKTLNILTIIHLTEMMMSIIIIIIIIINNNNNSPIVPRRW
jgi:energy-converting hydrogenase Eha subunit E